MGRHTKLKAPTAGRKATTRATRAPAAPRAVPSTDIEPLLARSLGQLELLLASSEATFAAGDANPALMRETSGLARAIVALSGEVRAREKAKWERAKSITQAQVMTFVRTLDDEERARLLREIEQASSSASVLG